MESLLIAVVLVGFFFLAHRHHSRVFVYPAHSEYWVYSKAAKLPDQTELMAQMVGNNPYIRRGQNPIGPTEGLMFSDVRFKLALVLRKKNPDFFIETFTEENGLPEQSEANAIIKLQYTSQIALKHIAHLQFLLHLADAVQRMQGNGLIYDVVQDRAFVGDDLAVILKSHFDVTRNEFHVSLIENEDHSFVSKGLRKVGLKEFVTPPVPFDEVQTIRVLLEGLIELIWNHRAYDVEHVAQHGDQFLFAFKEKMTFVEIRIRRKQEKRR
jgi:hypothetical protein